jgi:single-strand DNA-binding protein
MKDLNNVTIIGRLVSDPELKYTTSGSALCNISIANNADFKDQKHTNFFNVTIWSKLAENCSQYLKKGSQVMVTGSLKQETWEKDGKKNSSVKIIAEQIQFLGGKKTDSENKPSENKEPMNIDNSEDVPF